MGFGVWGLGFGVLFILINMSSIEKKLLNAIMFERENELQSILSNLPTPIDQLTVSDKNNNLIHFLTIHKKLSMLKQVYAIFKQNHGKEKNFKERQYKWFNMKNDKEFTPIAYATYNGDLVS